MADYIERDAAINAAADMLVFESNGETCSRSDFIDYATDWLAECQTSDVELVRHGYWKESSIPCEKYVCSECGGAAWYYDYKGNVAKSKYCPNCGAKMDGEAK